MPSLPPKADRTTPGTLTISIDVEQTWGYWPPPRRIIEGVLHEPVIIDRLLDLFARYDIRATWAIVGHLLLDACDRDCARIHPPVAFPPGGIASTVDGSNPRDRRDAAISRNMDIIERLRRAAPPQEIASHSFSHIRYDEQRTDPAAVKADIEKAKRVHELFKLPFQSFVFPDNVIGFRPLLAEAGIQAYRGRSPRWFDGLPAPIHGHLHLLTYMLEVTPSPVTVTIDEAGLVNIPDSMLLIARHGMRRIVPSVKLVRMGIRGLNRAVQRGGVFHLWFHPSNFLVKMEEQLSVLDQILHHAQLLRESGALEVLTVADIWGRMIEAKHSSSGPTTYPLPAKISRQRGHT